MEDLSSYSVGYLPNPLSHEELRAAFAFFCEASTGSPYSGEVSDSELLKCIVNEGHDPRHVKKRIEQESLAGVLNFGLFSKLYRSPELSAHVPQLAVYEQVFDFFDLDSSHVLDEAELKGAVERVSGKPVEESRYRELLRNLDKDGDGMVSKEEFLGWIATVYSRKKLLS